MTKLLNKSFVVLIAGLLTACGGDTDADATSGEANFVVAPSAAANETPRCFEATSARRLRDASGVHMSRDVLILVDQTTDFPESVRVAALEQAQNAMREGTRVTIGSFSAYTPDAHPQIHFEGFLEPSYPERLRNDAPMGALRTLDSCLSGRRTEETRRLSQSLNTVMQDTRPTTARSDILSNIKGFGTRLQASGAPETTLVLISDMLENSSALSFYRQGSMRTIDAAVEVENAARADLLAQLPRTKVYVIGAGLLPPGIEAYRSVDELRALEAFWRQYFERAGAQSVEFGKPILLTPIS